MPRAAASRRETYDFTPGSSLARQRSWEPMHSELQLEETPFQRRFEYFPGSFGCPLFWQEDSYEECIDDPAGAVASQHPGGRSGLLRELRTCVALDERSL